MRINEAIVAPRVRLVSDDGSMLGVFDAQQAVELARQKGLDLVEVSPDADPPVCKMLDFGRFKYAQRKREKESRKKTHANERKEIRFRPKTDTADLQRKLNHARELLEQGYRLQLTMRLRGREMAYKEQAAQTLISAVEQLSDVSSLESEGAEGRQLFAMLAPKKPAPKPKASSGRQTKKEKAGEETSGPPEEQVATESPAAGSEQSGIDEMVEEKGNSQ